MNAQQAVWQHYHFAQVQMADKKVHIRSASADPVRYRELYQRLQGMSRTARRLPSLEQPTKWQDVPVKDSEVEGLGLSEL